MNNPQAVFWDLYDKYEEEASKTFSRHNLIVVNRKALEMTVSDLVNPTPKQHENA